MNQDKISYLMDNKDMLPNTENNMVSIPVETLVEQEYMKPLYKYTKNKTCTGEVKVLYKDNDYDYQGYLTCDNFKTIILPIVISSMHKEELSAHIYLYQSGHVDSLFYSVG